MSSEHYISILGYLQTEVIKYQFSKVDKSGYRNMSSEDYISTVWHGWNLQAEVIKYQCSKVDTSGHRNMSSEHYI